MAPISHAVGEVDSVDANRRRTGMLHTLKALYVAKIVLTENRMANGSYSKLRAAEVRLEEVCPGEVRSTEVCIDEVRVDELRPGEVRPAEVRTCEVRKGENRTCEVRPGDVCPAEVRVVEVRDILGDLSFSSYSKRLHPR